VLETTASVGIFTGEAFPLEQINPSFEQHAFRANAGSTYYFSFFSSTYGGVTFSLSMRAGLPPANDDFANRTFLSGTDFVFPVDVHDATVEPGEPGYPDGYYPVRTVWFEWTAPASG